ncbi:MAG: hypothetical protein FWD48_07480 [Oscillospiraceae bacterium]|nr:hypothetical protein [Oscillospiraceae bacterium]
MKKFAVTILAVLMLAALAIPASAVNLGSFNEGGGAGDWANLWHTTGADNGARGGTLLIEDLQKATAIVVEFSAEPENNVQFIYFGDGNGWSWKDPVVFGPEQGTKMTIDLTSLAGWAEAVAGGGEDNAAKIGFGSEGIGPIITSATLVIPGNAAAAPTARADGGDVKTGVADVAVASAIALAAAGAVVLSRKKK